ncbi:MAG: hypothetical protein H6995_14015 [Pseudomonadales bacterium]|nr:hypothetical protein [Pseudomonadales bacterium]MCP5216115.1 hypothetical protein [Pseudomonadales bacterium]
MSSITTTSPHTITPELPKQLLSYARAGALGIVITVGNDKYPTDAFAWVVALDDKRVRFTVDHHSKTLGNLSRDGLAAIQIIGPDNLVFLIKGVCRSVKTNLESVPMDIGLWEMDVIGARDQSWPGAAPLPLAVQWSGDERESMVKTEQAVFGEMREA